MADANPTVSFGTIYTRGKKNTYYFQSKKHGVRQTSLKTTDPDEALERTLEIFGYLQYKDQLKQEEKLIQQHDTTKSKMEEAKPKKSLALDQIEGEYVKALKRIGTTRKKLHVDASGKSPLSPTTLKSTLGIVNQFVEWLKKEHSEITQMAEITPEIADTYFDHVRDTRSANTFNNHLSSLHVVWDRLAIKGGMEKNPFDSIIRLPQNIARTEMFSKRPFSLDQLETIFEKAGETRWQPICRIAYETGLRLGDIASILVSYLDLEGGYIDLRKKGTRKAGKEHLFYVPDSLPHIKKWADQLPEETEYLFPDLSRSYTGEVSRDNASRKFKVFLTDCGIDTQVEDDDGNKHTVYGFHSFRVAHATFSRTEGATVDEVQQQLGHSSKQTTNGYIQEADDAIKQRLVAEHRALPLAGGSKVKVLLQHIEKVYAELDEDERNLFADGVAEILGKCKNQ